MAPRGAPFPNEIAGVLHWDCCHVGSIRFSCAPRVNGLCDCFDAHQYSQVNKFPAARICPPFFPDVGGCAEDEIDAWVIYGRVADVALAIESLVYTPPHGDLAQTGASLNHSHSMP